MRWVVSRRRFVSSFMAADKNVDSIRAVSGGLPACSVVVVMSVGWSAYLELGALSSGRPGPLSGPTKTCFRFHSGHHFRGRRRRRGEEQRSQTMMPLFELTLSLDQVQVNDDTFPGK